MYNSTGVIYDHHLCSSKYVYNTGHRCVSYHPGKFYDTGLKQKKPFRLKVNQSLTPRLNIKSFLLNIGNIRSRYWNILPTKKLNRSDPLICCTNLSHVLAHNHSVCYSHIYRKSLNRFLKVCYVPATSPVLICFFSFFAAAINSTNEANKVASMRH